MRQRIENRITIDVKGADDLTMVTNIVVWVYQLSTKLKYEPMVLNQTQLLVTVPYEDAMRLRSGVSNMVDIQMAYTDISGVPKASEVVSIQVDRLLDEEGYR